MELRRIAPQFHLRCSSFLMIRDAGAKVEIWALQNQRRLSSSKVRAFLDALASLAK
jgi:hypothetical protein